MVSCRKYWFFKKTNESKFKENEVNFDAWNLSGKDQIEKGRERETIR